MEMDLSVVVAYLDFIMLGIMVILWVIAYDIRKFINRGQNEQTR